MKTVSACLIEPNQLSREGLSAILAREGIEVLTAVDALSALEAPCSTGSSPDLVIVACTADSVPESLSLEQIVTSFPASFVVGVTAVQDVDRIIECFKAGFKSVIPSDVSTEVFQKSLRLVLEGERVYPASAIESLLTGGPSDVQARDGTRAAAPRLSTRERQILEGLAMGNSNKVIANDLGLSEATVKVHIKSVLRKLRVRNRTQAAIWAMRNDVAVVATSQTN